MLAFTDTQDLTKYAMYVFDYGAPTGFRVAMQRPERVTAIETYADSGIMPRTDS